MTTVLDLLTDSLADIGAIAIGEPVPADEAASALRAFVQMVEQWNSEGLMAYNTETHVFNLTPGQTSYTVGTGGNFNIPRPAQVLAAYNRDVRGIDYPIYVTTNFQEYSEITYKTIQSPLVNVLYDNQDVPLKSLYLFPVPNTTDYTLVLWTSGAIDAGTALSDTITLPPGYKQALEFNLAVTLSPRYGKAVTPDLMRMAIESKAQIKRVNTDVGTLAIPDSIPQNTIGYSIQDFYAGR
jgi:hypothetical protein